MKAISLWQPWASAIALGSKRIETRSWSTNYRGPLAIHAAKRFVLDEMMCWAGSLSWCAALGWPFKDFSHPWERLPLGAIVAVCDLSDCLPIEAFPSMLLDEMKHRDGIRGGWTERMMGDFSPGRFGWVLENVRPLETPIPYRGAQGLFNVEIPL